MSVYKYDDFGPAIDDNDGILMVTQELLRNAHGAERNGRHVREAIQKELASRGIGSLPEDLPVYQHEAVRLYRLGSPTAAVISAVLHPSEAGDATLRQTTGSDAIDILNQVRELVCS